jgi:signal transduction histidine kinase
VAEINGYIENLLEGLAGPLTPRQKTYLEDMKEIGIENYRMICDLLSVSKIERGIISVSPVPIAAKRLVELSIRDYQGTIERKGLRLVLQGMEPEVLVMADPDKTVETLRNLINNAVKFTDRGSITISVLDLKDRAVLEVRDTGLGMDKETLERLFTKQRVLGKEAGRSGAGLGLFIAKRFMKLQNGDVEAVSTPGEGSCFRVTIPKAARPEGD